MTVCKRSLKGLVDLSCYFPLPHQMVYYPDGTVKSFVHGRAYALQQDYHNRLISGDIPREFVHSYHGEDLFIVNGEVRCGHCIGCRLDNARSWAIRCMHEASLHEKNVFITLTFDDEHYPEDGSLDIKHLQDFWKRFRKSIYPEKIRYYACGEYGSLYNRAHYHACVFGYWPEDAKLWSINHGQKLYVSPSLAKLWPFGFHSVGHVTFESAAYVARYITKKVTGKIAEYVYDGLKPEFCVASNKPGIAHDWIVKYHTDVFGDGCTIPDVVVVRDKFKCRPPRYYDKIYDTALDGDLEYLKNLRRDRASKISPVSSKRLEDISQAKELTLKQKLKRHFESD